MAVRMVRVYDPSGMFPDEERPACPRCGCPARWDEVLCSVCQEQENEDYDTLRELRRGPE